MSPFRPKPEAFRVKFSLWLKRSKIGTTDIAFVKKVHIHHGYNAASYENDIALLELKQLGGSQECLHENPAVRSVCVPWSIQQFPPGHKCTISGWGRNRGQSSASLIKLSFSMKSVDKKIEHVCPVCIYTHTYIVHTYTVHLNTTQTCRSLYVIGMHFDKLLMSVSWFHRGDVPEQVAVG